MVPFEHFRAMKVTIEVDLIGEDVKQMALGAEWSQPAIVSIVLDEVSPLPTLYIPAKQLCCKPLPMPNFVGGLKNCFPKDANGSVSCGK